MDHHETDVPNKHPTSGRVHAAVALSNQFYQSFDLLRVMGVGCGNNWHLYCYITAE